MNLVGYSLSPRSKQQLVRFVGEHNIRRVVFTFQGAERLFNELTKNGISTVRRVVDFDRVAGGEDPRPYLEQTLTRDSSTEIGSDAIQEIENGFLFRFPLLSYRVIGNFSDYNLSLRANIKAFTEDDVFVDMVELLWNRSRESPPGSALPPALSQW